MKIIIWLKGKKEYMELEIDSYTIQDRFLILEYQDDVQSKSFIRYMDLDTIDYFTIVQQGVNKC